MFQIKTKIKWPRFLPMWILSIVFGWSLIIYPGLSLREIVIYSWDMLPSIAWKMLISALMLGTVIGILQYLAFRIEINLSWKWIFISALSYGISTPLAFLILSAVIGYQEVFSSGGVAFMSLPLALTMLIGGCFAGIIQAYFLRVAFDLHRIRQIVLWTLGTGLSWGIGFFLTSYGKAVGLPLFMQSGLAGLAIGLITAFLLRIQFNRIPS